MLKILYLITCHGWKMRKRLEKKRTSLKNFFDEHLMEISDRPWFVDIANYKSIKSIMEDYTWQKKKKFHKEAIHYLWNESYLIKISVDSLICRCVAGKEARNIT